MDTTLALRPRDAARVLGISFRALWQMTHPRGPIPRVQLGNGRRKAVLYPVAALRDRLNAQVSGGNAATATGGESDVERR